MSEFTPGDVAHLNSVATLLEDLRFFRSGKPEVVRAIALKIQDRITERVADSPTPP